MEKCSRRLLAVAIAAATPGAALATNGMNLEGYGPIATAMGGASMAYDNGTAAVMNNPATIGLMPDDSDRLDVAWGNLGPDITVSNQNGTADSSADSFNMPAFGWVSHKGQWAYGVGAFAQGGMGAEYDPGSAVDQSGPGGVSFMAQIMANMGMPVDPSNTDEHIQRSELGVGRILFPVSYNVNDRLTVGGSLDYVWGGLDIMWSLDARNFLGALDTTPGVIDPGTSDALAVLGGAVAPQNNRGRVSGTLVDTFVQNFDTTAAGGSSAGAFNNFYWGHFDFSDSGDFTQETFGDGFAGKLGFTYRVNDQWTVGGTYHLETNMSDFEGDATATFKVDTTAAAGGLTGAEIPVTGEVRIIDFQWPETFALGFSYRPTDKLMVAADWKRLNWSEVMKNFQIKFMADDVQSNPLAAAFGGTELDFTYFQNWDDQDVIEIGAAYQVSPAFVVRGGYNHASNPIPDDTVNFLFPAIIEDHYSVGFGYLFTEASSVDFSLTYAPEVKVTESVTETNNLGTTPANTIAHSQTNWQIMYSYRW